MWEQECKFWYMAESRRDLMYLFSQFSWSCTSVPFARESAFACTLRMCFAICCNQKRCHDFLHSSPFILLRAHNSFIPEFVAIYLQLSFFIISPCLQKLANSVWRLYHISLMISGILHYENQVKPGQNCCLKVNILLSCLHLINKPILELTKQNNVTQIWK